MTRLILILYSFYSSEIIFKYENTFFKKFKLFFYFMISIKIIFFRFYLRILLFFYFIYYISFLTLLILQEKYTIFNFSYFSRKTYNILIFKNVKKFIILLLFYYFLILYFINIIKIPSLRGLGTPVLPIFDWGFLCWIYIFSRNFNFLNYFMKTVNILICLKREIFYLKSSKFWYFKNVKNNYFFQEKHTLIWCVQIGSFLLKIFEILIF